MRAILEGPLPLDEIPAGVDKLVQNLAANGVEEVSSLYLYFTPRANGETVRFLDLAGNEVETLRFEDPAPKPFIAISGGVKLEPPREY